MTTFVFSGTTNIELQGERTLQLRYNRNDHIEYKIIGLNQPPIILRDYRQHGITALHNLLETANLKAFAPQFNTPAAVIIEQNTKGELIVELRDTLETDPRNMLWIAIGIEDNLPVYDYNFCQIEPYGTNKFALFSLYRRPLKTDVNIQNT